MLTFFRHKKRRPSVRVHTSWYGLTERWWPDCFWVHVGLEAKERRISMRQPKKMAELVREMEQGYGQYLIECWPWVKDMQNRRQARG